MKSFGSIDLLSDTTAVICGGVGDVRVRTVKMFNLETDAEISCVDEDIEDAWGLATVKLGKNARPAISRRLVLQQ